MIATLALAGCTTSNSADDPNTPDPSLSAKDTTSPVSADIPQATVADPNTTGTAREQLDWYLNVLNRSAVLSEEAVDDRFAESLRAQLPYEQLVGLTNQLITTAPLSLGEVVEVPSSDLDVELGEAEAVNANLLSSNGAGFMIRIAVDAGGRITSLDVEQAETPALDAEPTSLEAAAKEVEPFGRYVWTAATIDLDVSRLADVDCHSVEGSGSDEPVAVGYAAKVWILGALADAIEAGELDWNTEVALSESAISLAPGILQDRPVGSPVEIGDAAKLLFESSDNTAADLLLLTLGRERVEQAQQRWGNSNADLNVPFMTTREMMVLKTATSEVQDEYLAADTATRRELLAEFDTVPLESISVDLFLEGPIRPHELSWFASPNDLCTALARLMWEGLNVEELEPLVEIITSNHGVPTDAQWSEIAYKGGLEPGMLTMAWVMALDGTDADEGDKTEWFGFVGSLVNPELDFGTADPPLLLAAGRDLVTTAPTSEGAPPSTSDGTPAETAPSNGSTPSTSVSGRASSG